MRIGDTLTVLAQPGSFQVEIVGIATFTTTNPGAALVFLDPKTAPTQLLGSAGKATSISVDAAKGVSDATLKSRVTAAVGTAATTSRPPTNRPSRPRRTSADSSTSSST